MNSIVLLKFMESTNYIGFFGDTVNILLISLGLLLICIELFIPGGIAGAIGCCIVFLTILFRTNSLSDFFIVLFMVTLIAIGICCLIWRIIPKEIRNRTLYLQTDLSKKEGYFPAPERGGYLNQEGVTKSILRPSGKIQIGSEILDAQAEQAFIEAGKPVIVIGVEGSQLIVRELL